MNKAVVVFSGGQDSSTCLYYALKKFDEIYTIGFNYGQRHSVELECRMDFLDELKDFDEENFKKYRGDKLIDMSSFSDLTDSALTKAGEKYVINKDNNLPTSFVPARNLIFLTYAAAFAYTVKSDTIITGVGQADYSGYPDCRDETIKALEKAINLGMESDIKLETPLMFKDKAQTFLWAREIGGEEFVRLIVEKTHTCYEGTHDILHEWGYGCGECPSCKLREKGYKEYSNLISKE
ncbi:MAG: 7-cyano-7-deazaguanine synthase QueC [Succinivibrio sp.]